MKRLTLFIVVITAFAVSEAAAQTDGYPVSGRVIDRVTREGIPYTPFTEIEMDLDAAQIAFSSVKPSPFVRSVESPVSVKIISFEFQRCRR